METMYNTYTTCAGIQYLPYPKHMKSSTHRDISKVNN